MNFKIQKLQETLHSLGVDPREINETVEILSDERYRPKTMQEAFKHELVEKHIPSHILDAIAKDEPQEPQQPSQPAPTERKPAPAIFQGGNTLADKRRAMAEETLKMYK